MDCIICPECESSCVHLEDCIIGKQDRGSRIEVMFFCEEGHRWSQTFQFHKGATFTAIVMRQPFAEGDPQKEMWRD